MSGENRTDLANGLVPWWKEDQKKTLENTTFPPRVISGVSVVIDDLPVGTHRHGLSQVVDSSDSLRLVYGETLSLETLARIKALAIENELFPTENLIEGEVGRYVGPSFIVDYKSAQDPRFLGTYTGVNLVTDKDLRKNRAKNKAARSARKIQRRKRK